MLFLLSSLLDFSGPNRGHLGLKQRFFTVFSVDPKNFGGHIKGSIQKDNKNRDYLSSSFIHNIKLQLLINTSTHWSDEGVERSDENLQAKVLEMKG